jgi:hypothetical protein
VLAVLYALVSAGYARLDDRARPLFDGFAPPPPYNWVNPPREFRAGNQMPKPGSFEVVLTPTGSVVGGGSSQDGQMIFSIPAGAFPASPTDARVKVNITPVDPAVLGPPPPGLQPNGNAYRVDFTYQPSGTPLPALAVPADVFLVVPEPAQALLFSPDGRTWESLPSRPVGDPSQIGGSISRPGYYEAVAPPVARPSESADSQDPAARLVRVAALTIALALALGLAPVGWRAIRTRAVR